MLQGSAVQGPLTKSCRRTRSGWRYFVSGSEPDARVDEELTELLQQRSVHQ